MIVNHYRNLSWGIPGIRLVLLCRVARLESARKQRMERVHELLCQLVLNDPSPSTRDSVMNTLAHMLFEQLKKQSWVPIHQKEWMREVAAVTTKRIVNKLFRQKERGADRKTLERDAATYSSHFKSEVFFIPEVINLIYSPHDETLDPFVNEGVNCHCRFIRRAVASMIRRHAGGMRELFNDHTDIEDELWGNVIEEIIRCMTDMSVRVWYKNRLEPIVLPPAGARGGRKGIPLRITLSENGERLAIHRSDSSLSVWDVRRQEMLHLWDVDFLSNGTDFRPRHLFFSSSGNAIALESDHDDVFVFPIGERNDPIRHYDESTKKKFCREFGKPFFPNYSRVNLKTFRIKTKRNLESTLMEYLDSIQDWTCNENGEIVATSSEIDRFMPDWMVDAGFERAVFHIAKKRLIDLIRKYSHIGFACGRCGTLSASPMETRCRKCGADFTICPIGCVIPTGESLNSANHWECPNCGLPSKLFIPQKEMNSEDLFGDPSVEWREWQEQHDLQRILDTLRNVSIAYKDQSIACDQILLLKSMGKTNEEIGKELHIPKGSVDYVWNQCRKRVLDSFEHKE